MRRCGLVLVLLVTTVVLAVGCQGPSVLTGTPTPVRRDTFVYKPMEVPRPLPPRIQPREEPPPPPPPLKVEPVLPAHDPAWEVSTPARPWRWIVIHHSASDTGSAAAFDAFHRNQKHWDELGYHFVIGNGGGSGDGLIEVGSRWPKQKYGAHCRVGNNEEYNDYGIGICLVGNFDRRRPTAAQMASLARLVSYLAAKYKIDDRHIIGHGTVDDTRCPGRCFLFDDLFARLRNGRAAHNAVAGLR